MDPLALVPFALAAAGGRVQAHDCSQLVAAGLTLLQRSAALVRALEGRRTALLLPPGPAWLVGLAASDGRGAVLLDPTEPITVDLLARWRVGAVFTSSTLSEKLPPGTPYVLLDHAPHRARVITRERDAEVDLGSHFALELVGDMEGPGAPEECVVDVRSDMARTHAELKDDARKRMATGHFTPVDRVVCTLPFTSDHAGAPLATCLAPLLAGSALFPVHVSDGALLAQSLVEYDATMLVTSPDMLAALLNAIGHPSLPDLRLKRVVCVGVGAPDLVTPAAAVGIPVTVA